MDVLRVPLFRDREIAAYALIEEQDAWLVFGRHWAIGANGYPITGKWTMHGLIMRGQVGQGRVVDHVNCDKLDNRRANLRVVTPKFNSRNTRGRLLCNGRPTTSRYRGVSLHNGKWRACARPDGKQHHLGTFDDELEAARVVQAFWAARGQPYEL